MRLPSLHSPLRWLLPLLLIITPLCSAVNMIQSQSLVTCQKNSKLTATLFRVTFTPANHTVHLDINGVTTISGNVTMQIAVNAYGYNALQKTFSPCQYLKQFSGLCPMSTGPLTLNADINVPKSVISTVPGIAYSIPDLDGQVEVKVFEQSTGQQVACVQASLSNGKTVYQKGVGWATAVTAGLALFVSAIVSGLGHSNTATHVAANAMSLFGYFQAQAIFGMTAVELPPIVSSWTQNFQWSMGIIHAGFIQDIASWYQQATGGTPSTLLSSLAITSVSVQKRSLDAVNSFVRRSVDTLGMDALVPRSISTLGMNALVPRSKKSVAAAAVDPVITIHGIDRVGFRAGIELTNIFMTGYIFFIIFVLFVILGVVIFRWILEALARSGKMKNDKFQDFRNGWTTVLRGILFRIVLIGFPQMIILCFWELTVQDSAGEMTLAVISVFTMIVMLAWACSKVWRLARRSIAMHKNPAYILYSDPVCLHKWGFLYVQFKATAYWFIIPVLSYLLVVGLFIAFGQGSGDAQAVALLILTASLLVGVSILRPYMDKKTNAFNISIAAVNFVSAIFLLFFTNIFGLPGLVVGVMGVIFFIMNAAFALILLLMVLVATAYAIFSKNPDIRYQPMRDDRGSFIKSQSALTTELDALGATARGEAKMPFKSREIDEDSVSDNSFGTPNRNSVGTYGRSPYGSKGANSPYEGSGSLYVPGVDKSQSSRSSGSQQQRVQSPWQRGAGYER